MSLKPQNILSKYFKFNLSLSKSNLNIGLKEIINSGIKSKNTRDNLPEGRDQCSRKTDPNSLQIFVRKIFTGDFFTRDFLSGSIFSTALILLLGFSASMLSYHNLSFGTSQSSSQSKDEAILPLSGLLLSGLSKDIRRVENLENPESVYAQPPSSLDLIDVFLEDAKKRNQNPDGSNNPNRQLKRSNNNNALAVNNPVNNLAQKIKKERINMSNPAEPRTVYDSILTPQESSDFERNPFDYEQPDSFFN